ncbi:FtsK/SpoIIIE domain-containing protein [Mycolicibacterium llatzerense]|uniref:FtsK/SpoIIIE domain-containing protein n=1 Tax=Mycolicibacterium llatzerense TaxID=280871 RepID=UPI0021B6A63D|nr:FtsK/SpoIIIE domain-containing protein [Mycolicibacterium llatzerense]MCT7373365.1 hypothetical protein [Mycolicibacterium llatzerense]
MSDNSFKGKARRQQRATGASYMRARREVDSRRGEAGDVPGSADATQLLSLLGLGDAGVDDIAALWAARALPVGTGDRLNLGPLLRVPLGLGVGGVPVWLDLKEEADGGAGPHLLQVGETGSGKTALLRSMLAGLCLQHSPELLQLVLVEVKAWEFDGFAGYPHTAAILRRDNCVASLDDLLDERARALAAAGVDSFGDYRELRARPEGADLPALPIVLVVVDELTELHRSVAGFADLLDALLHPRRALGIHVVAVGQHGGVAVGSPGSARTIDSRIALRLHSAPESYLLVGNSDAHELPVGVGLYSPKWGVEAERFRAFLVPTDLIGDLGRRFAEAAARPE